MVYVAWILFLYAFFYSTLKGTIIFSGTLQSLPLSVLVPIFAFLSRCSFPASLRNYVSFPNSVIFSGQLSITSSLTALTCSHYLAAFAYFSVLAITSS